MNMDEYLDELKGQIRDRYAKTFVSDEIRSHIEEQTDAYVKKGMSRDEAVSHAVRDMGDPVQVGVDLDRIHRPHMEWRFFGFVLFISMMSIGVHLLINSASGQQLGINSVFEYISRAHILSIIVGICMMLIVYRADYTFLLGKSRIIGALYLIVVAFMSGLFEHSYKINGINRWQTMSRAMLLLYLPLYAAILYEYRGKGRSALFKIILWSVAPLLCRFISGDVPASYGLFIIVCEIILLGLAFHKNWYGVNKRSVKIVTGVILLISLIIGIITITQADGYRKARIDNWLGRLGIIDYMTDDQGANYINARLNDVFTHCRLLQRSDEVIQRVEDIPGFRGDLVLAAIASNIGLIGMVGVIICLFALSVYVFRISYRQKNNLGYIVGCACGIAIGLQCLTNILIVFGVLPLADTSLPFFSVGMSFMVADYMLMGLILSIHRYKDIRTDRTAVKSIYAE